MLQRTLIVKFVEGTSKQKIDGVIDVLNDFLCVDSVTIKPYTDEIIDKAFEIDEIAGD